MLERVGEEVGLAKFFLLHGQAQDLPSDENIVTRMAFAARLSVEASKEKKIGIKSRLSPVGKKHFFGTSLHFKKRFPLTLTTTQLTPLTGIPGLL